MENNNADIIKDQVNHFKSSFNFLLGVIGVQAKNHFVDNFAKQGFDGNKWERRKSEKDSGRAILVKTGDLRNSIQVGMIDSTSVTIKSDVPYASYINDGTDKMPARKILGESKELDRIIVKEVEKKINSIFSNKR
jgi:phage gpG-like protein